MSRISRRIPIGIPSGIPSGVPTGNRYGKFGQGTLRARNRGRRWTVVKDERQEQREQREERWRGWMVAAQAGDAAAYEKLLFELLPHLRGFVRRRLSSSRPDPRAYSSSTG